jgi:ABC-type amino acid transport substrate-binding protein
MLRNGNAGISVDPAQAPALAAEDPALTVLRRMDQIIGVEVDLAKTTDARLAELVELAWRHRAPKRLVKARGSDS